MNIETRVEPRLWTVVRSSVESRQFTNAVLDAVHFLSDVIRERSGLEGDGVALIGQAFGGNNPKLKVNRLQTESEQNVQRGVESLLRGIYQAIRNPRSHGTSQDDERDATAILLFVDYLLRVVDETKSPFTLSAYVARVLDPGFVPKERYAKLLVDEIPPTKRSHVCAEVFARRTESKLERLKYFFGALVPLLSEADRTEFAHLVSEELRETEDNATMIFIIGAFALSIWPELTEISRLRCEHKLIESIKTGRINEKTGQVLAGGFGAWAQSLLKHLLLRDELWRAVGDRLKSEDRHAQEFAIYFFASHFDKYYDSPPTFLKHTVRKGLKAGDTRFQSLADGWTYEYGGGQRSESHPWRADFADALSAFVPAQSELTDDDIPF